MRNKRSQELITSPFSGCQTNFLSLVIHHLTILDVLIQRGLIMSFQKLQLIIYANNFMML